MSWLARLGDVLMRAGVWCFVQSSPVLPPESVVLLEDDADQWVCPECGAQFVLDQEDL